MLWRLRLGLAVGPACRAARPGDCGPDQARARAHRRARVAPPPNALWLPGSPPGRFSLRCNSSGQLVAPEILAPTLVFFGVHHPRLRQKRLDLRLQARRLFAHPLIAHRLALARVRSHLRPVDRELAEPRQSHLARHLHHPHKQLAELRQMSAAELTYRAMLREVARREHPKRYILLQLPRHRARGECARRVGIDQHLDHHRRLVGGVASTVPLVGRIERRQVQCIDHIADVMSQVSWGNPLLQVRPAKARVGPAGRHETWSASGVPTTQLAYRIILPPAQIHPQPVRYQLCRADLSAAHAPRARSGDRNIPFPHRRAAAATPSSDFSIGAAPPRCAAGRTRACRDALAGPGAGHGRARILGRGAPRQARLDARRAMRRSACADEITIGFRAAGSSWPTRSTALDSNRGAASRSTSAPRRAASPTCFFSAGRRACTRSTSATASSTGGFAMTSG